MTEILDTNLNTKELAGLFRVEPGTVRRAYCIDGHYLSLRPVKLANKRLLWPRAEALRVIGGGQKATMQREG